MRLTKQKADVKKDEPKKETKKPNPLLEFDSESKKIDFKNIVNEKNSKTSKLAVSQAKLKENSPDFVDDTDVPPLI